MTCRLDISPVWFPVNHLLIESPQKFHHYYGPDFRIECPTESGIILTLEEVSMELSQRLSRLFLRRQDGRRVVLGGVDRLQADPHFRDYVLVHEYFDGDEANPDPSDHEFRPESLNCRPATMVLLTTSLLAPPKGSSA
jgi:hypothetical protein